MIITNVLSFSQLTIATDGTNFNAMWQFADVLELSSLHTNDISAALAYYGIALYLVFLCRCLSLSICLYSLSPFCDSGVEVARSLLIKEIVGVFQAYSIKVNRRHLDLVADYMR